MKTGGAIGLIVVGLILALHVVRFPYELSTYVNFGSLGWILVICGILALLLTLWGEYMATRQKITYAEDDRRGLRERRTTREPRRW